MSDFAKALEKQKYGSGVSNVTYKTYDRKDVDRIKKEAAAHYDEALRLSKFKDSPSKNIITHKRKSAELNKKAAEIEKSLRKEK